VTGLTGRPTAAELVSAVADFLDDEVRGACEGQVAFHVRVAANALRIVERELTADDAADAVRAMAELGADDEPALIALIRDGALDGRDHEVLACLRSLVRHRLAIDHPGYADPH
jgi:hypothetical protein